MIPRIAVLALAVIAASCSMPDARSRTGPTEPASLSKAPETCDDYIVQLRKDAGPSSAWAKAHGVSPKFAYLRALNGFSGMLCGASAAAIEKSPHVVAVTKARRFNPPVTGDPVQSPTPSWGLERIDQSGPVAAQSSKWKYTYWPSAGSGVHAYVIGSGIRTTHADFAGRIGVGVDLVGDGLGVEDCTGHDTHVAGTIGGTVYGVAKLVTLHPIRIFPCTGSIGEPVVIAALDSVLAIRSSPCIVNMSLTSDVNDAPLNQAVENTVAAGCVVVVAAGNSNADACLFSPGAAPSAITVGASNISDARWASSNWGACVDLFAPGSNIRSDGIANDTASFGRTGTSMAAPHVAGAAALYLGVNPFATPATVTSYLLSTATVGALANIGAGSPNLLLRTHAP